MSPIVIIACFTVLSVAVGISAGIARRKYQIYDAHMSFVYERLAESSRKTNELSVQLAELEESIAYQEEYVPADNEFDERIQRFREELNTPTYANNDASTEPGVYNLPHHYVTDTPLRYEEEYAE